METRRLATSNEGLNSSRAGSAGELWSCKVAHAGLVQSRVQSTNILYTSAFGVTGKKRLMRRVLTRSKVWKLNRTIVFHYMLQISI